MKTILVVEDEPAIRALVRDHLEHAGFAVVFASDGASGLHAARVRRPDLVILDLGLPEIDGLDVARALRSGDGPPIIMLTARATEADTLVGLELGADDYVTKPFSPRELIARVRAVLRRTERAAAAAANEDIVVGDLAIDVPRLSVTAAGRPVNLTATEFDLLATLARQPGRVFTRSQLLDAVHGVADASFDRAIDAHVKNIRRKLEPDPRVPRYIGTVYGVGYRLLEPAEPTGVGRTTAVEPDPGR